MTIEEVKKMVNSGKKYDDAHPEVANYRNKAIAACRKYNFKINSENHYDTNILKKLFGSLGENTYIESNFQCEFGFNIHIGSNLYINHDLIILDCNEVTIGSDVYIGPRVGLFCANHAEDPDERAAHVVYSKPITICDRVWLGANASVLPGVTIGENTIIGAGSVVTKDVPANMVAAGNPCRVIRPVRRKGRQAI